MGLKLYLPVSLAVFLAATTGADAFAGMSLGGQTFAAALQENLYWARVELFGSLLLLAPFIAVAAVCALVERRARSRTVLLIFAVAMLALLCFYFQAYQTAERAELQHMWTAATLSIAFLPLGIGLAVVLAVILFGWLATELDPRLRDQGRKQT
jgi:uncharacterized membrane-anchored protein